MATITSSLVVSFSNTNNDGQPNAILNLQVDGRDDGLNGGDTSFIPFANAYFLRFKTPNVTINTQGTTDGQIASAGSGQWSYDDKVNFNNTKEVTLPYPVSDSFAVTVLGSTFDASGAAKSLTPVLQDGYRLVLPEVGYGVFRVVYKSNYEAFRLHSVAERAIVFAIGTVT